MGKALLAVLVVALLAWGQVSDTTADELSAQQNLYCEMVAEGSWGDYNENFDEVCL